MVSTAGLARGPGSSGVESSIPGPSWKHDPGSEGRGTRGGLPAPNSAFRSAFVAGRAAPWSSHLRAPRAPSTPLPGLRRGPPLPRPTTALPSRCAANPPLPGSSRGLFVFPRNAKWLGSARHREDPVSI